jgi:hypothetical protein
MELKNTYFFSDFELELLKKTFADNEPLLKLLRKVFVPRYLDTASDIGGITDDMSNNSEFDVKSYPSLEQAMVGIQARSMMVRHCENSLWRIKMLAGQKTESIEQTKARLQKDSAK